MKVAVTGARGFIGSHLVKHLAAAEHQVVALGRGPDGGDLQVILPDTGRGVNAPGASLEGLLEGVDVVMHLAGRSSSDRSLGGLMGSAGTSALSDYLEANVVLTERLLKATLQVGSKRFIYASSRMVYPSSIGEPRREDMPWRTDSAYGLSKRVAEELVRMYSDGGRLSGISLRLSQVIGEGDGNRGVLPRFIDAVRAGALPTVFGAGRAVRDFVDVRDVVRAFAMSAASSLSFEVINIGGERGYSVREMAEAVAREGGLDPANIAFKPLDDEDCSSYTLDCGRAKKLLGWVPEWTMEKTIRERLGRPS